MHDLVVRGGMVVDGTGGPRFAADVAVDGGVITAVGSVGDRGRREIDASGCIVTPGFVDIHTHYDGQVTWDDALAPSSGHGVTSAVMGNCGVGFAPAAPDRHDFLIALMEGVEDIPGAVLAEGLPWNWETFPQYLDSIASRPLAIDIGAQVPHAALRAYVMGERGADHEQDPTPEEIAAMSRMVRDSLLAGAMGFSTSRTLAHRTRDGAKIGTLTAKEEELVGIAEALRETGRGVMQFVTDYRDPVADVELIPRLAKETGRPASMGLIQADPDPERWRGILSLIEAAAGEGADLKAQVATRPIGVLIGLEGSMQPFMLTPTFRSIAGLPLAERVARMRQPEVRASIVAEFGPAESPLPMMRRLMRSLHKVFVLGDPPDYEPAAEDSIAARAEREGHDPVGAVYDALLQRDGHELLYFPSSQFAGCTLDAAHEMIESPRSLFSLSDGGAHVAFICDGSVPTYNLTHWARDRKRGPRFDLEYVVRRQTHDTARHVGWLDRGLLRPGYKADLNVIDFDRLQLRPPHIAYDLPAGGKRLLQEAEGYRFTVKAGTVTFEDGRHTGALPAGLVRGARPAPV